MTTFQAIVYAIVRGFTEFLPLSWDAHRALISTLAHWPEPSGYFDGALTLGAFLALFSYFRHEWASILSCFIQVLIYRRKPMTLDERLPFFLAITIVPTVLARPFLAVQIPIEWTPIPIALCLAATGGLLALTESTSRKNRGIFDWSWLEAAIASVLLLATALIGVGAFAAIWISAMIRNINREAAAKLVFFALTPLLGIEALTELHGLSWHQARPMEDMSWFTLGVAGAVSFFTGLLVLGGVMKSVQRKGFAQYAIYRVILAVGAGAWYWWQSR